MLLAVLSLLICLATAALWITSLVCVRPNSYGMIRPIELYRRGDPADVSHYIFLTSSGDIAFDKTTGNKTIHLNGTEVVEIQTLEHWSVLGIGFARDMSVKRADSGNGPVLPGTYGRSSSLWIPLFWPMLVSALLPGWLITRF